MRKAGTQIRTLDVTGGVSIQANNVTIRDTRIRCAGVDDWCLSTAPGVTGLHVEDSEIGGGNDGTTYSAATGVLLAHADTATTAGVNQLTRLIIHHTDDGVRADGNAAITGSWIHDLMFSAHVHSDGVQSTGWPHISITGNLIDGGTNDCIFLNAEPSNPSISDVIISGNVFIGRTVDSAITSYAIGLGNGVDVASVAVTGNVFQGHFEGRSPVDADKSPGIWAANTFADGTVAGPP